MMELGIVKAIASIFLPPTGLIVLGVLGIGLSLIWRKTGLWLAAISLTSLLLCSLPVVSAGLINSLQSDHSIIAKELKPKIAEADAVVLLAGGRRVSATEYGGDTLSRFSLRELAMPPGS